MIATMVVVLLAAGLVISALRNRRLRRHVTGLAWSVAHDDLTALHSRTGLSERYSALPAGLDVMVFLIDLDQFKAVNDRWGHAAGDAIITAAGDRIGEVAAAYHGFAARMSGDEFAAVIPLPGNSIGRIAELLHQMIAQPVSISTGYTTVTVVPQASIGATTADSRDQLYGTPMRHADIAMYQAKKAGGAGYVIFQPGMHMPDTPPRHGPRIRDLRHLQPITPAHLPPTDPDGRPIVAAMRLPEHRGHAVFAVVSGILADPHAPQFAVAHVHLAPDGTAIFTSPRPGLTWRQALDTLASIAGLTAGRHRQPTSRTP
jgi:diguanylate cyclase (GGDEF)-like protein